MLNTTILSLHLLNLQGAAPLLTRTHQTLTMKNLYFGLSATSILCLNSFSRISLDSVQFHKFAMSPIHLSSLSYLNKTFSEQSKFSENEVVLTKCLFLNCVCTNSSGGAIFMDLDLHDSTSLYVNCSGFANCSTSEEGGAIFCRAKNITLYRTCFQNCYADKIHGQIINLKSANDIQLNYIQINQDVEHIQNSDLFYTEALMKNIFNTINISNSEFSNGFQFQSHLSELSFISLSNSTCDSLLVFQNTGILFTYCDVINSSAKKSFLISRKSLLMIVDSAFIGISPDLIDFDEFSRIQLTSISVGKNVKIDSQFLTEGIIYNDDATYANLIQLNSDYCWVGQATWDVTNIKFKLSGASISFAVICFCVSCIYIYLKRKLDQPLSEEDVSPKRRKSSDWNDLEEPEEDEILIINEEIQEEESEVEQNSQSDNEIPLKNISVEQTSENPTKEKSDANTYN
ncbi:hypothetical protein TRFO_22464 [Tritrichomonas foetus]|uniref:Right handed beta helix domain-containing protein n=1 Tax=Tritrichomonas foetus TaxID=1144522 RepID=A0A1J4KD92_9EUKA|nr:hypothetical protein TRFO_22464 [Tritrichomonas foetus]|eukprot:OHT08880.1 hypothetical protein TRFO_22464 [Tritrichomonas foetus]